MLGFVLMDLTKMFLGCQCPDHWVGGNSFFEKISLVRLLTFRGAHVASPRVVELFQFLFLFGHVLALTSGLIKSKQALDGFLEACAACTSNFGLALLQALITV
jgi:hypothetical protein